MLIESPAGLYCQAGGFHVDPWGPFERALITHAHGDHARAGSRAYLCTESTTAPRTAARPGIDGRITALRRVVTLGSVRVSFHPAGHILGSAQIRLDGPEGVWVVAGDYKRAADPTCTPASSRCAATSSSPSRRSGFQSIAGIRHRSSSPTSLNGGKRIAATAAHRSSSATPSARCSVSSPSSPPSPTVRPSCTA